MATISLTLPSDGQTIDASDVNNPLNTIAAEINGNLDNSNIKAGAAIERSKIAGFTDGWEALGYAPSTVTANGNRSYDLTISSVDITGNVSPGMRLKLTRTVTAPTYAGGLLNGSSHYFTKVTPTGTLSTVTNNFTLMAWVEPTAYQAGWIGGRFDAAGNNGLGFKIESTGVFSVAVVNGGSANYRILQSYQSLPLNKKTHVAATWTGGTVVLYFDGVSVPVQTASTGGTAPTTAGTGGDWAIGRKGAASAEYFAGYVSNMAAFDAVLTASTIKSYMSQKLAGNETNCIGAWALNNNGTDDNSAGNTVTATGGVSYTNNKAPFTQDVTGTSVTAGTTNYAIITKASFSTNTTLTVQVPEGDTIPTSGGVSAVSYSTQKVPYGFPSQRAKWVVTWLNKAQTNFGNGTTSGTWQSGPTNGSFAMTIPVGEWVISYNMSRYVDNGTASSLELFSSFSTSNSSESDGIWTTWAKGSVSGGIAYLAVQLVKTENLSLTTATTYYILGKANTTAGTFGNNILSSTTASTVDAVPAYL